MSAVSTTAVTTATVTTVAVTTVACQRTAGDKGRRHERDEPGIFCREKMSQHGKNASYRLERIPRARAATETCSLPGLQRLLMAANVATDGRRPKQADYPVSPEETQTSTFEEGKADAKLYAVATIFNFVPNLRNIGRRRHVCPTTTCYQFNDT